MKSIYEHQTLISGMGLTVKEYLQPHFTSPFHFHNLYELILIVNSYGKLYVGNKVENFVQDEIFLLGPGLPHCFYNEKTFISTGETAHAIVIFFKEDFLGKDFFSSDEMVRTKDLLREATLGIKIKNPDEQMRTIFTEIKRKKGIETVISLLQLLNLLSKQKNKLSSINAEMSKVALTNTDSARLEPVLKYIFENFKNDLRVKEAASIACLNEAAFCRYFKSRTEETFSQFVNQVRVTHATRLLAQKDISMSDIAYECGFKNISYFNRQFKKITEETPSEYRKMLLYPEDELVTITKEDI